MLTKGPEIASIAVRFLADSLAVGEWCVVNCDRSPDCLGNSGPIAQSVEQLAFNQWVAGSSPARLTTRLRKKAV